jgi:hypothetical protein
MSGLQAGGVVNGGIVVFNNMCSEETRELLLTFMLPPAPQPPAAPQAPAAPQPSAAPQDPAAAAPASPLGAVAGAGAPAGAVVARRHLADVLLQYVDAASGADVSLVVPVFILGTAPGDAPQAQRVPHPLVLTTAARYETADVIERATRLAAGGPGGGAGGGGGSSAGWEQAISLLATQAAVLHNMSSSMPSAHRAPSAAAAASTIR